MPAQDALLLTLSIPIGRYPAQGAVVIQIFPVKEHVDFQAIQLAFEFGEILLEQVLTTQVLADSQVQSTPYTSAKLLQISNLKLSVP